MPFEEALREIKEMKPEYITFDTETTGLDILSDIPFIATIAFDDVCAVFETTMHNMNAFYKAVPKETIVFAQNAKYDWHIVKNNDTPIPDTMIYVDNLTIVRLVSFVDDDDMFSIGLDKLGEQYVDPTAKFASGVIKKRLKEINSARLRDVKALVKKTFPKLKNITEVFRAYRNRVKFVEYELDPVFEFIHDMYREPDYYDVYLESPDLMKSYALDDAVILNEYLKKAVPTMKRIYGKVLTKVVLQENKLISVVGNFERNGIPVDIDYLLKAREDVLAYQEKTYQKLFELTGRTFTVNQHDYIMRMFLSDYDVYMSNCDKDALEDVASTYKGKPAEVAELILHIRDLSRDLSQYIEGMLNRVVNGRVYTEIKNFGTVTGRVSSDMQQQPSDAIFTKDGVELFHPRRAFINEDEFETHYFDYSQMELRVQAHYTLMTGQGDIALCRAYMPYKCTSIVSGKEFHYPNDDIWSGEWIDENGNPWTPLDVHSHTTRIAFPDVEEGTEEFNKHRKYGKRANFLKNYCGGAEKLAKSLKVSLEVAKIVDNAYYEAFPKVRDYQKWTTGMLYKYGYVENLYGRRYYFQNSRFYYRGSNYLVQGSCADILKEKEIIISNLLEGKKSYIVLVVHDEIQIMIHKDEKYLVDVIKDVMNDNKLLLPLTCDVEVTHTNWAEKEDL